MDIFLLMWINSRVVVVVTICLYVVSVCGEMMAFFLGAKDLVLSFSAVSFYGFGNMSDGTASG